MSSELIILECLVGPLKTKDSGLIAAYETALGARDLSLLPVTDQILRDAASLRATHNLKTPDAIHAATALSVNVEISDSLLYYLKVLYMEGIF